MSVRDIVHTSVEVPQRIASFHFCNLQSVICVGEVPMKRIYKPNATDMDKRPSATVEHPLA